MLVWHFVTRKWLFEDPDGKPLPREKALANLKTYIDGVVGHYRGRIRAWDVVNEAISDNDGEFLRVTPALRAIGPDYIKAFEFAHAADPAAALYYNDYNIEQPPKLEKTLRLVGRSRRTGVRLDAVGIQGHWLVNWPPTGDDRERDRCARGDRCEGDDHRNGRRPAASRGERRGHDPGRKGANPYPNGLPPEMQEKLAKRYAEIVAAIVRHRSVTMLSFWGTHDGRSWLNDYPVKGRTNYPLLFDRQLQTKPAFESVIKALGQR